jgi:hypothetical protein
MGTKRTRGARPRRNGSKGRGGGGGGGKGVRIGRLPGFDAVANEGVFFKHARGDRLSGEARCGRECVNCLLERPKVFAHGVQKKDGKDVIIPEWSHRSDSLVECTNFRECFTNGFFVAELKFESFEK